MADEDKTARIFQLEAELAAEKMLCKHWRHLALDAERRLDVSEALVETLEDVIRAAVRAEGRA